MPTHHRPKLTDLQNATHRRRKHFLRKRRYADAFSQAGDPVTAQKLYDCQETYELVCCGSCRSHWWTTSRCRLRVCPLCAYDRARERAEYLKAMARRMPFPKLLTLTMPLWRDDPAAGIKALRAAWNQLKRHRLFRKCKGGAYQIELKPKDNGWHIHIHLLLEMPYLPYQQIFTHWARLTGNPVPQVDIRAATNERAQAYVAKYASKSAGFDARPSDVVAWYNATKGSRLFSTFGTWFNFRVEDEKTPQPNVPPPRPCPFCGAVGQTFYARDGPRLYGYELWRAIAYDFLRGEVETKPIPEVQDILDNPPSSEKPTTQPSLPTQTPEATP